MSVFNSAVRYNVRLNEYMHTIRDWHDYTLSSIFHKNIIELFVRLLGSKIIRSGDIASPRGEIKFNVVGTVRPGEY